MAQAVKNLPTMWDTWVQSLGQKDPLEKGEWLLTAVFSPVENSMDRGAWWTTVMGSQRVRHD